MTTERWSLLADLVADAMERPATARAAFLDQACGDDAELRAQAGRLAAAHEAADAADAFATPVGALAAEALAAEAMPERVGPWRLTGVLGEGGMGVVYRATRDDGAYDREVALKRLHAGHRAAVRDRFEAERRVLAPLEHPGIARFYDGGLDDSGAPFLVMELVEGEPLTDYADRAALDVPGRVRLLAEVCEAVAYAHQHLVVHRDLKPSNILVTSGDGGLGTGDGQDVADARTPLRPSPIPYRPAVKLLDFGIAKLLSDDDPDGLRTAAGVMTPAYAAPEQVRGGTITTATDVYALGVLAYELLAGRRPYDLADRTAAEVERIVCDDEPPPPSAVAPPDRARALRGDLDVIVQTAMAKAPSRRYASADALRADLLATLDDLPIAARPPSRMDRAARFVRRNRGTVAAAAAVLVALAGGLVATTWQARVARAEAAKAQAVQDFLGNMLSAAGLEAEGRDVRVADLLDQAAASLDTAFARQPAVRADAHDRLGRTYYDLGLLDEASAQFRLSLALHEQLYGADDPRTASVQIFLATARRELSDYRTADSLYAVALATRERALGADHPQTAVALSEIGTLRYQQGDNAGAAAAYRRMLHIEEGVLAPDDPGLAISYANLAAALAGLDQTDEAARLLLRAADIQRTGRSPQAEMNLANTLSNLGALYARAERFEDAARVQAEAVALFRRALGDDHPSTAFGLSNYGSTLTSLGRAREAEPLLRESMAIYSAALGEANPTVGFPTINLAKALAAQGRTAEARAQARAARALFVGGFEPGHWAIERADEVLAGLASARP